MGVQYIHAKEGYKFEITFMGKKVGAVSAKYREGANLFKQYQHHVPKTWVTNGYVEEVKEKIV